MPLSVEMADVQTVCHFVYRLRPLLSLLLLLAACLLQPCTPHPTDNIRPLLHTVAPDVLVTSAHSRQSLYQGLKIPFCVPTDELLRAKDDLLSEEGQSLFPREGEKGRKGWERKRRKGKRRGRKKRKDNLHPTQFLGPALYSSTMVACYAYV